MKANKKSLLVRNMDILEILKWTDPSKYPDYKGLDHTGNIKGSNKMGLLHKNYGISH